MTDLNPGSTTAHEFASDPASLTPGELRRYVRLHRKRIGSLVDLLDLAVDERRRLREETRHLRAENERLVRLARTYQEQAGMTPGNTTQKEG